ncbi:MAG: flavodoxin-dependent (E)-4-hydroxy-3-methylbut-2-enyl-diphosphate synthase [Candidatus Desulfovibrio faecigallinarum]|nr:flavodoxin-dependent (E)-4-hydroxy-3-methylbut-2-enyl-diphosphate synthase [Candidatus Desulfovibrio faecigallinarum]
MASKHVVRLGPLKIGGGNPVMVQSMTNTDTRDVEATLGQIGRLVERGCEAVRVAVPDDRAADVLRELHDKSPVPLIADIHFDWRLAVRAIEAGFEGLRINPGNIGDESRVERVVRAAKANGAAIRVGVNSGSVEKELLERYGGPVPRAMAESAVNHVRMVEKYGLDQIVVSVKSSSVLDTVACYRELARLVPYPLHLGVTEAGSLMRGTVKSAAGLGILLFEGIGDTIRVSLTADPVEEIDVAWELLRCLGLRYYGPEIISCPTCGRTEIDLIGMEKAVSERLKGCRANIRVAVMGCVVNGPGEAREADIGLAGGRDRGIIFRKGEIVRSVKGQDALLAAFMEELQKLLAETEQA